MLSQLMPGVLVFDLTIIPLSLLILLWRRHRDIRRFGAPRYRYGWYAASIITIAVMGTLGPASAIYNPGGNTPVFLATEAVIVVLGGFCLYAGPQTLSRPRPR